MVGWGGDIGLLLGVDRNSLIGNLSDITVHVVSSVLDVLGSAVGKGNGVATGNVSGRISGLSGVELSLAVVIGNSVFVSIRSRFTLLDVGRGGVVGGGVSNDGGVVDNGSVVDNGGMVDQRGGVVDKRGSVVDNRGGVVDRGTVDGGSMVDNGVTAMGVSVSGGNLRQSLGVVDLVDGSVASTESLRLVQSSHLSISLKYKSI